MSIASNKYNLQCAKQSARGVYPANPTHFFEMPGSGLTNKPTIDKLNICDGLLWTSAKKRIGYIETGGTPEVIGQPSGIGLLLYGALGGKSVAGAGDPYTHTITPATTMAGFPYFTFWQYFDDQWSQFRDCQIVGIDVEASVDSKFMRLKPTIIGMSRRMKVAAPGVPATEETVQFNWLDAGGYHYAGGDYAHALHTALPTDLATVKTALAAFKTAYNLHMAVATGVHHKAADAVNVLAYATPCADEAACVAACTEIRLDFNAHCALTTTHYFADILNPIVHANPTDTATCITFLAEAMGKTNSPGSYDRHLGAKAGVRAFKFSAQLAATPIQGEDLSAYIVQRKKGTILASEDILLEDFELLNLAIYGDTNPAAGTEAVDTLTTSSLYVKFLYQTTPERSVAFTVPQFDFDPEPLQSITGNPEGNEIIATIGGEASGSAPIATCTVCNETSAY